MLNTLAYTEPSSVVATPSKFEPTMVEHVWTRISATIWYGDGVFLSKRKGDAENTSTALHLINQREERSLLELYYEDCSDFKIVEYSECREIRAGEWVAYFVGRKESQEGAPAEFFATILMFPTCPNKPTKTTVLTLWSQEDKTDIGTRELILTNESNPYERVHDDCFVFHALSKLRQRMDSLIGSASLFR